MIDGYDNDDGYIMVEDEFYAMAQEFTQHLHYDEYIRRSKEATAINAATIKDMARPTDGVTPTPDETKRKKISKELLNRQEAGIEQILGKRTADVDADDADEQVNDEDLFVGTPLYDLAMNRKARLLAGSPRKSSTRAAAGYSRTGTSFRPYSRGNVGNSSPPLRSAPGATKQQQRQQQQPSRGAKDNVTTVFSGADYDDDDELDLPAFRNESATIRPDRKRSPPLLSRDQRPGRVQSGTTSLGDGKEIRTSSSATDTRNPRQRPSAFTTRERRIPFDDDFDDDLDVIPGSDNKKGEEGKERSRSKENPGDDWRKSEKKPKESILDTPAFGNKSVTTTKPPKPHRPPLPSRGHEQQPVRAGLNTTSIALDNGGGKGIRTNSSTVDVRNPRQRPSAFATRERRIPFDDGFDD